MRHASLAAVLTLLATSMIGCDNSDTADDTTDDGEGGTSSDGGGPGSGAGDPGTTTPEKAKAVLEIHPRDIWAQPLPETEGVLTVTRNGNDVPLDGYAPARIYLDQPGTFTIHLEAPQHEPLDVEVTWDGGATNIGALLASATEGHGALLAHDVETVEGREVPIHRVYLGLRHKWFSAEGRPARRGNNIDVYMDGETAWSAVHEDMAAAQEEVLAASWWWESDFELVRDPADHMYLTPEERWANTMLGTLERNPAIIRVLIGQFWGQDGILSDVNVDDYILAYAEQPGEGIEFMGQANMTEGTFHFSVPGFRFGDRLKAADKTIGGVEFDGDEAIESTVPERDIDLTEWPVDVEVQAASYHQKFSVIDHEVAFVGGMNVKATDWDTSNHYVFEERRMAFDATLAERQDVQSGAADSDTGPRKDYIVRIDGPSAQDVADVFQKRWSYQISQGVDYSENASNFDVERDIAPRTGGLQVQVTTTLPEPFWEHSIAETWFNAVRNAEDYIFIEDQYWRIPMLNEAIAARMDEKPNLVLVVITKPVSEWTDPGCAQTNIADQMFEERFGDRYVTLQLRSFDAVVTWGIDETESRFADMDVHSKLLMVDDTFVSIGSANKNNRGIVYEGEMNVAIADPATVNTLRRRILSNLMPSWSQTDDSTLWVQDLRDAAAWNDWVYGNWDAEGGDISLDGDPLPDDYTPYGFVYGLEFRSLDDCLFESIGPDMVGNEDGVPKD